jgi:uncharacterized damage-inducible protein DinB
MPGPMTAAEAQHLQAYQRWANARSFEAVGALDPERLGLDLGTSHGSVLGTLVHMVWADWIWLGRWLRAQESPNADAGSGPGPGPDPKECRDLPALRARWAELERVQRSFVEGVTDAALAARVRYVNLRGVPCSYPLAEMIRHVVNHGSYHRGQVTTLLRQLGATPTSTDFLDYVDGIMPTRGD